MFEHDEMEDGEHWWRIMKNYEEYWRILQKDPHDPKSGLKLKERQKYLEPRRKNLFFFWICFEQTQ